MKFQPYRCDRAGTIKQHQCKIRTQKTVNGTTTKYSLEGGKIVKQTDGTNTLLFNYSASGELISCEYGGNMFYYVKNNQGDIIGMQKQNGVMVANYTYDTWGNLLSITDEIGNDKTTHTTHISQLNPFRYRGYFYDRESGLYYLNSRYYSPEWGRFINADAFTNTGKGVLSQNMFAYCENDPVNMVDPSGCIPQGYTASQWYQMSAAQQNAYLSNPRLRHQKEQEKEYVAKKKAIAQKATPATTKSFSFANHATKISVTTPEAMLNGGVFFGKVGFSTTTTTYQSKELGLLYSYAENNTSVGSNSTKYGAGINADDWLGAGVGASSEINVYVEAQVTPWVHAEVSLGLDGVGAVIGIDGGKTAYDFEVKGGWALVIIVVGAFAGASAGAGSGSPAPVPSY